MELHACRLISVLWLFYFLPGGMVIDAKSSSGIAVPFSDEEAGQIVAAHNEGRGSVTPPAADMEYMVGSQFRT